MAKKNRANSRPADSVYTDEEQDFSDPEDYVDDIPDEGNNLLILHIICCFVLTVSIELLCYCYIRAKFQSS